MNKKSLCAVIDVEIHNKIREQQTAQEITLTEYIENTFKEYFEMKEKRSQMEDTRTLAIQIPSELMNRVKIHLKTNKITQKAFLIDIIEKALIENTEEENTEINTEPTDTEDE